MTIEARRWLMTAVGSPLVAASFRADPGPGEVAVAIAGCGVCHTDLGYYYDGVRTNHPLPLALGHEISGSVVAAGDGAQTWLGKSVIVPAVLPCGECDLCRRGLGADLPRAEDAGQRHPRRLRDAHRRAGPGPVRRRRGAARRGGPHAARSVDRRRRADDARTRRCGAPASGRAASPSWSASGGWAGTACRWPAHSAPTVVAIDVDADKLAAIAQAGAALTLDARTLDGKAIKAAVNAFAKEQGLRPTEWFIFECSGTAAGQLSAWGLLVHGATLSVVGFTMDKVEVRLSNLMAFDARALGNWGCPPDQYPAALDLVLTGKVALKPFVETHPLDDINRVFAAVHHREIKKRAVLVPA